MARSVTRQDHLTAPIDEVSRAALAERGLSLELVDPADDRFTLWLEADMRGFLAGHPSTDDVDETTQTRADHRYTGVFDETAHDAFPVATVASWPTTLTLPGASHVEAWAISSVTVAATHRRNGIARALLEAELRTAHSLGVPVAILTVSEATIYGRFGFAPAAFVADLTIDTRRTGWAGPRPGGRVRFTTAENIREIAPGIADEVHDATPGEIPFQPDVMRRMTGFGTASSRVEAAKKLRFLRYDDESGVPRGFAIYEAHENEQDYSSSRLDIHQLYAATDDAYAGLWSFFVEHDLIATVTAQLRSVDEPVRWQVADYRAITESRVTEHLWARILDVPAALESRVYGAAGRFALTVADDLGFTTGVYVLDIDAAGNGRVSRVEAGATDAAVADAAVADALAIRLRINELSAMLLGGVAPATLHRAGRLGADSASDVARLASAFASPVTPYLSFWF